MGLLCCRDRGRELRFRGSAVSILPVLDLTEFPMKTVLLSGVAILGMMLAVPAFACDGHKGGATAQNEKTGCDACGTDKCTCDKEKEATTCTACGTDKCACGHGDKDAKKDAKKS